MAGFTRTLSAFLYILFYFSTSLSGQLSKHGNIWHFGNRAGLDFSSGAPVQLTNVNMDSFEGCAVYCDANGQMLLYTNGGGIANNWINGLRDGIIWNRNQQIMYNMGLNEGGGYSAVQSALILPKPGNPDRYFVFTMDDDSSFPQKGLSYFEVDMTANAGLGAVVAPSINIYKPATEGLTAIPMSGGNGFWIIVVNNLTNDIVVTPFTNTGIGASFSQPRKSNQYVKMIKASPDGKYLCIRDEVYYFDASNGKTSFKEAIPISLYCLSFSPSSRYLYGFESLVSSKILRYDVTADLIEKAVMTVTLDTILGEHGAMQIGPDGNIYFVEQTKKDYITLNRPVSLSVIHCPDGLSPSIERSLFKYPTDLTNALGYFSSLPNFADYIFATTPIQDTIKQSICGNQSLEIGPGPGTAHFHWSTGDTTAYINVTQAGTYVVDYQDACGFRKRTYLIDKVSAANVQLKVPNITNTCMPFPLNLKVIAPSVSSVLWQDGTTTDSLVIKSFGTFTAQVTAPCFDTILTYTISPPLVTVQIQLENAQDTCSALPIALNTSVNIPDGQWLWSTGATTTSIQADKYGIYTVVFATVCGIARDTFVVVESKSNCCFPNIPNAFTPNGDGLNDTFSPKFKGCVVEFLEMNVYSRWGELVFQGIYPGDTWNGQTLNGNDAALDVYYYLVTYQLKGKSLERRNGQVTLLR
jgi:gliding motility-associated-like protein